MIKESTSASDVRTVRAGGGLGPLYLAVDTADPPTGGRGEYIQVGGCLGYSHAFFVFFYLSLLFNLLQDKTYTEYEVIYYILSKRHQFHLLYLKVGSHVKRVGFENVPSVEQILCFWFTLSQ